MQEPMHVHLQTAMPERVTVVDQMAVVASLAGPPDTGSEQADPPNDEELHMDGTTHNGIPAGELVGVTWHKSRRSSPSGNCVELARLPENSGFAIRNSRDPQGPALIYTAAEIAAFVGGARDGDFDDLIA
jgi:hypothetical protein